jgi:hypothetical protein
LFHTHVGRISSFNGTVRGVSDETCASGGGEEDPPIEPEFTAVTELQSSCGGDDPNMTCYTVQTDHYWYYPDTGEYEYRYTTYMDYCYLNET